ncbi:MAG: hypothetical protein J6S73_07855, partial [Lentisphaeria bacterium]|nr:hypothetical protein [Lentisphaeria bacterium]
MKKSWMAVLAAVAGACSLSAAEVLLEEDFAFANPGKQMPKGFTYFYGSKFPKGTATKTDWEIRKYQDGCEIVFDDQCEKTGIGLGYCLDVEPGAVYRATVTGAVLPGRNTKNVNVQLAAGSAKKAVPLNAPADGSEVTREVELEVPAGEMKANFHVYSVYDGTPGFIVRLVKIERIKDAPEVPVEVKLAEGGKVLMDEDFSKYEVKDGVPEGYKLFYSSKMKDGKPDAKVGMAMSKEGKKVFVLEDNCSKTGLGPYKDFPAVGGKTYRATVIARALPDRSSKGAVLQFNMAKSTAVRTLPKGRLTDTVLEYT